MTAGGNTNILAIACLCATFVAIDGPLLQRASSVLPRVPDDPIPLAVSICPELPSYSTGLTVYRDEIGLPMFDWTREFMPFVREYNNNLPVRGVVGCKSGTCSATVCNR